MKNSEPVEYNEETHELDNCLYQTDELELTEDASYSRFELLCNRCKNKVINHSFIKECKNCNKKRRCFDEQMDRELNPEFYDVNYKICISCSITKKLSEFQVQRTECRECRTTYDLERRKKNPTYQMWLSAKSRAKRDNREFTITPKDIETVWTNHCPIFDIPLIHNIGIPGPNSPSLDRINNNKGYTPDNIAVVSNKFNSMKRDLTPDILTKMLKYMNGTLF